MTNFLPAGLICDTLSELYQKLILLRTQTSVLNDDALKQGLNEMGDITLELLVFLQNLACQPLIYTGRGTTDEVIKRLDWALTFTEDVDAAKLVNAYIKNQKKQNAR